jgi:hypothetical protein
MEKKLLGTITNAEIKQGSKGVTGGLYITFNPLENVVKNNKVQITFQEKTYSFDIVSIQIDGKYLKVEAVEYGYWSSFLSRKSNLDIRSLIALGVSLITDVEELKQLENSANYC